MRQKSFFSKYENLQIALIAFFVTLIVLLLTNSLFSKYKAEIVYKEKKDGTYVFHTDVNNDGKTEAVKCVKNENGNNIGIGQNDQYFSKQINIVGEFPISANLMIGDYNNNPKNKEIFLISVENDSVFLSGYQTGDYKELNPLFYRRFITKTQLNHNEKYDIELIEKYFFADKNNDGYKELYFVIISSFSFTPRNIFCYDIKNDKLIKSHEYGEMLGKINIVSEKDILLTTNVISTGNIDSLHPTLESDFEAYFTIYNKNLKPIFEPIILGGYGTYINSQVVQFDEKKYIAVLVRDFREIKKTRLILFSEQGKIISEKYLDKKPSWTYFNFVENMPTNSSEIIISTNFGEVLTFDKNLEIVKRRKIMNLDEKSPMKVFRFNIDDNKKDEYVFTSQEKMLITDINFKNPVEVEMGNANFIYPTIDNDGEKKLISFYSTDKTRYKIEYKERERHFIYFGIYAIIFVAVFLTFKLINNVRLNVENKKLNKMVEENVREILAQKHELEQKNNELLKLDQYKQNITNMLVHDLKNPLNLIINNCDNPKVADSATQMSTLVNNILDVSKFQDAKMKLIWEDIDVKQVVKQAFTNVEYIFDEKNIAFEYRSNHKITVEADQNIFLRVLINLLNNAAKFTPNNGRVVVETEILTDKILKLNVIDTGIGIPENEIDSIFDKFSHIDTKNKYKSTGLGLTFCKMAVEAMHGKIGVKSKLEEGTTFWFTLKINTLEELIEIEEKTKKEFDFSKEEIEILKPFIKKLKTLKAYEISEILTILDEISNTESQNIQKWAEKYKNAAFSSNSELLNKLLEI